MILAPCFLFLGFLLPSKTLAKQNDLLVRAAESACQALSETFNTETYLPTNASYVDITEYNWSQSAWLKPSCVITPATVEELQTTIKLITQHQSTFAIRSGGHSTVPEAGNIDGGVLIDMTYIYEITYNAEDNTMVVGSGNRWGDVYRALDRKNRTAVGGRILGIGVAGSTLGSGLSYLTDQYGLACDNVFNFEVVLADGSLVNANKDENSDLFWALKGGTNNFGIVTRFKINTFPQGKVWGGIKGYSNSQLPELLDALAVYQANPNKDPKANLMLQSAVTNDTIGTLLNVVYLDPVEAPDAFAPFYNISTAFDTTKIQTLTSFMSGAILPPIPRWDFHTTSLRPSKELYAEVHKIITNKEELAKLTAVTAGSIVLGFQPISAAVAGHGVERGGNALGLSPVSQTWMVADTAWWNGADDKVATAVPASIFAKIDAVSKEMGLYERYLFMNDAGRGQDVIASYGAENVQKLKAVQERYDPNLVFQKLATGGYKLG